MRGVISRGLSLFIVIYVVGCNSNVAPFYEAESSESPFGASVDRDEVEGTLTGEGPQAAPASDYSFEQATDPVSDEEELFPVGSESKGEAEPPEPPLSCDIEGGFGCPCDSNDECSSGYCATSPEGGICSKTCVDDCPQGWGCIPLSVNGPDVVFYCMPDSPYLCHPCQASTECSIQGANGEGAKCVVYGPEQGSFCGSACEKDSDCQVGYGCQEVVTAEGATSNQCRLLDAEACPCNEASDGKATSCSVVNDAGSCEGTRWCENNALTPCDAEVPEQETCDGIDNDCDGLVDDDCDNDGIPNNQDNCPEVYNPDQLDTDGDGQGDACDADDDNDGSLDEDDCEPLDNSVCPNCEEVCDGKDNDCDGQVDEGLCDDGNLCTTDSCNVTGECQYVNNSNPCDDGDVCSVGDACAEGICQSGSPKTCDDEEPCTIDTCSPATGCENVAITGPCEDGDLCNSGDFCLDGSCISGTETKCDDGNPCTADECEADGDCSFIPFNPCNDGDPCTTDQCDPVAGCIAIPATGPACDDGLNCTENDSCLEGTCGGSPIACDDGNVCTTDSCDEQVLCVFSDNGIACDDGNACSATDVCSGGLCIGQGAPNCDDGNPCTDDGCSPDTGCVHTNNQAGCSDGNACTVSDVCSNGACIGSGAPNCNDGNGCTNDSCNPATGCVNTPNSAGCNDGNSCTVGDVCSAGSCVGGGAPNCDDGNPCTTDQCDPGAGCVHTNNSSACNDGNACTSNDKCSNGSCNGGPAISCSDGNPCTNDSCNPGSGCVFSNNSAGCSDGDACTLNDKCKNGSCKAGSQKNCDDGNPCTLDACFGGSCKNTFSEALCNTGGGCG